MDYLLVTKLLSLGVTAFLLSCTPSPPLTVSPAPSVSPTSPSLTRGQVLPITAQAEIGGQIIQLEVAETPEQQSMGLMYRPPLPDDRGMLFPFEPARQVRFWMENTPSPLDIIFLRDGEVKEIAANVPPCTSSPCPTYGPWADINQVLELRSGRAAELGLKVGDRIVIRPLE